MKFTKIRLNGLTVVDLPIVEALPSDRYILKSVDGLGPPEVDVSIADTLNAGGVYQGRRPQSRQIVMMIGLNPDFSALETASDLRTSLYGMLTPGYQDNITVEIVNGNTVVAGTTGYVSKLEINPFSKDPEVQLTVDCLQQYLVAPNTVFIVPASKSNPEIMNLGSAPAGFHMEVIFTQDLGGWTLYDGKGKKMEFSYNFLLGDKLEFDTRPGFRGVWVTRAGVRTNIIWCLGMFSTWYMLHGGLNLLKTTHSGFNWGDVYFIPQHWGI